MLSLISTNYRGLTSDDVSRVSDKPMHPIEERSELGPWMRSEEGDNELEAGKTEQDKPQDGMPILAVFGRESLLVDEDEDGPTNCKEDGREHAENVNL
jgi:hypothetical protein